LSSGKRKSGGLNEDSGCERKGRHREDHDGGKPTAFGLHDLERITSLVKNFKVTAKVLINKFDLDEEKSDRIERYCAENRIEVLTKIPFDEKIVKAISQGILPVDFSDGKGAKALAKLTEGVFVC
jgi:MinD superfamily P-loop ATPase